MSDDPQLNRDDFEDCFAGQPAPVSVADDLARGRHRLRRRRRMAGGAVAGVVAAVVLAVPLLTSQTFGPRPVDPAQTPTGQPTSMRTQATMNTCSPATFKIGDAATDPAERPIVDDRFQSSEEDGESVLLKTVGATGEVLLEIGRDDRSENDVSDLRPGRLYLEDVATGKRTLVRGEDDAHRGTQTFAAAVDENFVVWLETPDTSVGIATWTMYAFDRDTGKISKVADSGNEPDEITVDPEPKLWNGSVYWNEGRKNPDGDQPALSNIYARTLTGTEPTRLVVKNAVEPEPTDGWLYYAAYDPATGDNGYAIHRKSLTGDRTELVHRDPKKSAFGLAASGDLSAWSEDDDLVVFRGTELIARFVPPKGHSTNYVTAGDGTIGFSSSDGGGDEFGLLLDLRDGCRLHQLDHSAGLSIVELAGRTVAWSTPEPGHDRMAWNFGRLR
jgi:hypothetical protein